MLFIFKHEGMVLSQNSFQHFAGSPFDLSGKILFALCGRGTLTPAQIHTSSTASHSTPPLCHTNTISGTSRWKPHILLPKNWDVYYCQLGEKSCLSTQRHLHCRISLLPAPLDEQNTPKEALAVWIQVIYVHREEPHSLTWCASQPYNTHKNTVSPIDRVRFTYHLGSS